MSKYLVFWDENVTYSVEIEADSGREAIDKWHASDYDMEQVTESGCIIVEDSVDCEAI